jgi:transposase-like protein
MQILTPVQSQVLAGLLAGQPIAAVAREHGIHRSTIYNWRNDHPGFAAALNQARASLQTALYDEVQDLAFQALEVLADLLHSTDNNLRLRAAQALLRAAPPRLPNEPISPEFDTIRHISTPEMPSTPKASPRPGRNEQCPCNSGMKYKKCCGNPARPPVERPQTDRQP